MSAASESSCCSVTALTAASMVAASSGKTSPTVDDMPERRREGSRPPGPILRPASNPGPLARVS
jgi:hypothetical protein